MNATTITRRGVLKLRVDADEDALQIAATDWVAKQAERFVRPWMMWAISNGDHDPMIRSFQHSLSEVGSMLLLDNVYRHKIPKELVVIPYDDGTKIRHANAKTVELKVASAGLVELQDMPKELLDNLEDRLIRVVGRLVVDIRIPIWFNSRPALTARLNMLYLPVFTRLGNSTHRTHGDRLMIVYRVDWSPESQAEVAILGSEFAVSSLVSYLIKANNMATPFPGGAADGNSSN